MLECKPPSILCETYETLTTTYSRNQTVPVAGHHPQSVVTVRVISSTQNTHLLSVATQTEGKICGDRASMELSIDKKKKR